jgi:hypothetical protein
MGGARVAPSSRSRTSSPPRAAPQICNRSLTPVQRSAAQPSELAAISNRSRSRGPQAAAACRESVEAVFVVRSGPRSPLAAAAATTLAAQPHTSACRAAPSHLLCSRPLPVSFVATNASCRAGAAPRCIRPRQRQSAPAPPRSRPPAPSEPAAHAEQRVASPQSGPSGPGRGRRAPGWKCPPAVPLPPPSLLPRAQAAAPPRIAAAACPTKPQRSPPFGGAVRRESPCGRPAPPRLRRHGPQPARGRLSERSRCPDHNSLAARRPLLASLLARLALRPRQQGGVPRRAQAAIRRRTQARGYIAKRPRASNAAGAEPCAPRPLALHPSNGCSAVRRRSRSPRPRKFTSCSRRGTPRPLQSERLR